MGKTISDSLPISYWFRATDVKPTQIREWASAVLFVLSLTILTFVPYDLAYIFERPGTVFTGALMNSQDTNSYLAKMEQGYNGSWLYSIPFTSEDHSPAFLGGFYLMLGHAARTFHVSIIQMWHVARAVFTFLMFLTTFAFIRHFLSDLRQRWVAYLLAVTGSGFGWLLLMAGQVNWLGDMPVDFKMPEAHLFFSALTYPHFAVGVALILGSLWMSLRFFEPNRLRFALGSSVLNLALAIVYPFMIYLIAAVLAFNWIQACLSVRRVLLRQAVGVAVSMMLPLPLLIYYSVILRTNLVFRTWDIQAVTPSPNALHYLMAYGALLLLAIPTLRDAKLRPLWLWIMAVAILVYAPLNAQRRFVEGVQVPLSILAAAGLGAYYLPRLRASSIFNGVARRFHYSPEGLERFLVVGLLLLFAVSNIYTLLSMSVTAAVVEPFPFFRQDTEEEAVVWAGANLPHYAIVMSSYETGNNIPTQTGLRSFVGHWAETMNWEQKLEQLGLFFNRETSNDWRMSFLAANHSEYVWYGPEEKKLGDFDPVDLPQATEIYRNRDIIIYRIGIKP